MADDAKAKEAAKADATAAAPAHKKGMPSAVWMAAAALVIIAAAYGFVQFAMPQTTSDDPAQAAKHEEPPEKKTERDIVAIQPLLVNLAGSGSKRYLKAGLAVEFEAENKEPIKKRFEEKKVLLQDRLIEILSSQTVASVEGNEKKAKLKVTLSEALEKLLFEGEEPDGKIVQVLFTEWVVQ